MDLKQLIQNITPEIYQNLKRAIEIGKWPDGREVSTEQRENAMQAVIAYEIEHNLADQQRVGFVNMSGSNCHNEDGSTKPDNLEQAKPIKWH